MNYNAFKSQLKGLYGVDLDNGCTGTEQTLTIAETMKRHKIKGFNELLQRLSNDTPFLTRFIDSLTINSTEFFRELKYWDVLKIILRPSGNSIKCWVAACSSGQDAYSLAIWLAENFPSYSHEILATDISIEHLEKAQNGRYSKEEMETCPVEYKEKYFIEFADYYEAKPILKQVIKFEAHNLLGDQFKQNFDLILCKNVSFYFSKSEAIKLFGRLRSSLVDRGILSLGLTDEYFNMPDVISFKSIGFFRIMNIFYGKLR